MILKVLKFYYRLTLILNFRIDGIDEHVKRLDAIESNIKMRPNELDYRRLEWDNGYNDFREAVKRLEADLQAFLREWIERPVPTTQVNYSCYKITCFM